MADARTAELTMQAAQAGDGNAQCELAMMYEHGIGVPLDAQKAVHWYSTAAEGGNGFAAYKLSAMYESAAMGAPNYEQAVVWLRKSAECDYPEGQYKLAMMLDQGRMVDPNQKEAAKWYAKAAEHNVIDANYRLGCLYENGQGVKKDLSAAAKYYEVAAKANNANAQYNLAIMNVQGKGMQQNLGEAQRLLQLAADLGHQQAKQTLNAASRVPLQKAISEEENDKDKKDKEPSWHQAPKREETWTEFWISTFRSTFIIFGFLLVCALTPVGDVLQMILKTTGPGLGIVLGLIIFVGGFGAMSFFAKKGGNKAPPWFTIITVGIVFVVIVIIIGIVGYGGYKVQPITNDGSFPKVNEEIQTHYKKIAPQLPDQQ